MVELDIVITFKASEKARDVYDKAAESVNMDRSTWIRTVLDAAAGVSNLPDQMMRIIQVQSKPVRDGKW